MKEILVVGGGAARHCRRAQRCRGRRPCDDPRRIEPAREKTARYWERAVQFGQYPDCAGMLSHGAARSVESAAEADAGDADDRLF